MNAAFVLALCSGLAHAAWNALAKVPGHERAATWVALFVSWLAALLWWAVTGGAVAVLHAPWIVLAGLGEAAYVFALGMAYARGDLALTYAVSRAAALVFVWPLSAIAFGTTPTPLALLATVAVVVGIVLARRAPTTPATTTASRWHPGWTLATGAAVALYHTGYKGAVDAGASQAGAFVLALSVALPLLFVVLGAGVRVQVPTLLRRPRLLVAGGLCATSFLLMLSALADADSGRILGVRNSSVGFALLLALILGERPSARQWWGIGVLFVGVAAFGLDQASR
jgi:drug/metabolite transporter (DMT)-like permease